MFLLDVSWKTHSRHPLTHLRGGSSPALILQCVNDILACTRAYPAIRARRSHECGKIAAPLARVLAQRMSAPHASWVGQLRYKSPAAAAYDALVGSTEQPVAYDAAYRKEKIAQRSCQRARPVSSRSAFHITSASGSSLNHSRNAATP